MGSPSQGTGEDRLTGCEDAVDWVVTNSADRKPDAVTRLKWRRWQEKPGNRAEYEAVVEMLQLVRLLSPPAEGGRDG